MKNRKSPGEKLYVFFVKFFTIYLLTELVIHLNEIMLDQPKMNKMTSYSFLVMATNKMKRLNLYFGDKVQVAETIDHWASSAEESQDEARIQQIRRRLKGKLSGFQSSQSSESIR